MRLLGISATVRAEVQEEWGEEQENFAPAVVQAEATQAEVAQMLTVQVAGVCLNPAVNGLEVILETIDGQILLPVTSVIGDALSLALSPSNFRAIQEESIDFTIETRL